MLTLWHIGPKLSPENSIVLQKEIAEHPKRINNLVIEAADNIGLTSYIGINNSRVTTRVSANPFVFQRFLDEYLTLCRQEEETGKCIIFGDTNDRVHKHVFAKYGDKFHCINQSE